MRRTHWLLAPRHLASYEPSAVPDAPNTDAHGSPNTSRRMDKSDKTHCHAVALSRELLVVGTVESDL